MNQSCCVLVSGATEDGDDVPAVKRIRPS